MVDVDVRLGLSGSDLALRERSWKADLAGRTGVAIAQDDLPELHALRSDGIAIDDLVLVRSHGIDSVYCQPEVVVDVLRALKMSCGYVLLSDLFAIDCSGLGVEHRFEVVYSLFHPELARRIVVKAVVAGTENTVPTACGVWSAANWPEREVYDMFGVVFDGHPDLRRILMPDDWIGHPLRKDFPLGGEEVEFSHNVREQ